MARLEDLTPGAAVKGILPNGLVTVVGTRWHGAATLELTYKDATGRVAGRASGARSASAAIHSSELAVP